MLDNLNEYGDFGNNHFDTLTPTAGSGAEVVVWVAVGVGAEVVAEVVAAVGWSFYGERKFVNFGLPFGFFAGSPVIDTSGVVSFDFFSYFSAFFAISFYFFDL